MLVSILALMLTPAVPTSASNSHDAVIVREEVAVTGIQTEPRVAALAGDRMVPVALPEGQVHELAVRISSPAGLLWQGNLRVAQNQSANYSQNFNQASPIICSNPSPYDRSERSSINFNVYVQNNGEYGPLYRFDASWQRPTEETGCGERGTRTVQVSKALGLDPGESGVVEGDAGLKVEVTRRR
jgi:hypothetical protein